MDKLYRCWSPHTQLETSRS